MPHCTSADETVPQEPGNNKLICHSALYVHITYINYSRRLELNMFGLRNESNVWGIKRKKGHNAHSTLLQKFFFLFFGWSLTYQKILDLFLISHDNTLHLNLFWFMIISNFKHRYIWGHTKVFQFNLMQNHLNITTNQKRALHPQSNKN